MPLDVGGAVKEYQPRTERIYKYRLEVGCHSEGTPVINNASGIEEIRHTMYYQGEYFLSVHPDLVERFGADKFTRLPDNFVMPASGKADEPNKLQPNAGPIPQLPTGGNAQVDLSSMTIPELREYAAGEEIDLGGATKKDDIIAVIQKFSEKE